MTADAETKTDWEEQSERCETYYCADCGDEKDDEEAEYCDACAERLTPEPVTPAWWKR